MSVKYPQIKFIIDPKEDTLNAVNFVTRNLKDKPIFVSWFLPMNLQYIMSSNFSQKERIKILRAYTPHIYKINPRKIALGVKEVIKDWGRVQNKYFKLVDEIFYKRKWPKGNYCAYASIFTMYPRDIKSKLFYFPFTHNIPKFANCVIGHEMMHFMFFDYVKEKYGLKEGDKIKGKPNDYLWQVSEVFNDVIEKWHPYNCIFKRASKPYPGQEKMYKQMLKDWQEKQDVDWLLDKWLKK